MTNWLDVDQQRHWRAYIAATTLLHEQLSRELQDEHGISMGHLADSTLASRSRLSHQIDRLEKAGVVRRQACDEDRRGQNAILTDEGFALLVGAAPTHVTGVRKYLVDLLTAEQFSALGRACEIIAENLDENPFALKVCPTGNEKNRDLL